MSLSRSLAGIMSIEECTAKKQFNSFKLSDLNRKDIEEIQQWLIAQPHLPHNHITETDIILAYVCCGRDRESSKRAIDLNFTLRSLFTFYSHRFLDNALKMACHTWLMTPLKTHTLKGHRAIYCHLLDTDTKKFVYSDVVRAFVMILDLWQYEEGDLTELAIIVNMDKVSLGHVSGIDLTTAQQFFYFLQEAMFIRIKEFHFINAPNFVDKMLTMIEPFLKENMLSSLKIHPVGSDSLDQYIPRYALPKEAGGEYKDFITLRDEMLEKINSNAVFFSEEAQKRVDESKRPGGERTISSYFPSIEGSFKNLAID